jgi:hypothetical protein
LRPKAYSDDFKKMVTSDYANGLAASECVEKYQISRNALWKWIKEYGIQPRGWDEASTVRFKSKVSGENHWNYKGGWLDRNGYFLVCIDGKERALHDLIAEKVLGRPLRPGELVHHINGDKTDNRNQNFIVCLKNYHKYLHSKWIISKLRGAGLWRGNTQKEQKVNIPGSIA